YKTIKTDNTGKGSNNTASLFIERSLGFLKQNCKLGFIVPNSILRIPQFNKIRKVILENYYVFKIRDEGFPYVGVNLEMVTILLSNEKRKQYFIKCESSKVSDKCAVSANSALSLGYIPLYYDNIFDYLLNLKNAKYGILHAIQGKPRKADYVKEGIRCISSKVIDPYVLKMEKDKHRIVPNTFKYIDEEYEKNLLITPYFFGSDLSSLKKDVIEATIKPKGYITDGNGVLLICKENLIKPLCVILNSKLINHIIKKYVLNYSIRDITIREDTLLKVPFIIPHNKKYITTLSNILLFTNQYYYNNFLSNNKENQELKEQIKLFNELANYLIYELYFKDKFKKDKTPTNLLNLIKAKLKDVNYDDWIKLEFKEREILSKKEREDKEKLELKNLKIIKTVYNKISKDNKVNKEIEKIKSNEWVKVIDEKY
ncbi:MAG: Eco57I restriction-modification methylase domain-containing protein, partial [Methanosarcinales archaeon]